MEPSQTQRGTKHAGRFAAPLLGGSSPKHTQAPVDHAILHILD